MAVATGSGIDLEDVKEVVTCGICLQLYADPRRLRCSHTFCLQCLNEYQSTQTWKECPTCRTDCIPCQNDLEKLPVDQQAIDLIGLVKMYDPTVVVSEPRWHATPKKPDVKKIQPVSSESAVSIGSSSSSSSSRSSPEATLDGLVTHLAELQSGLGGMLGSERGDLLRSILEDSEIGQLLSREDGEDSTPLTGVEHSGMKCDSCKRTIRGERFKCGVCPDFELCSSCAGKTRNLVHDTEHIFVKLKKPAVRCPSPGPVLHDDAIVMGMSMDTQKTEHTLGLERETITYRCHNCNASPIRGTRFKCGYCQNYDLCSSCEKRSAEFHDENHVFLEIPHPTGMHTTKPQVKFNFY